MAEPRLYTAHSGGRLVEAMQYQGRDDVQQWLAANHIKAQDATERGERKLLLLLDRRGGVDGAHVARMGDWIVHDRAAKRGMQWFRIDEYVFERRYRPSGMRRAA